MAEAPQTLPKADRRQADTSAEPSGVKATTEQTPNTKTVADNAIQPRQERMFMTPAWHHDHESQVGKC